MLNYKISKKLIKIDIVQNIIHKHIRLDTNNKNKTRKSPKYIEKLNNA